MDEQDELLVLGREEQPLAAALGAREPPALERGEGRVERLQRRDVGGPGLLDRKRAHGIVEGAPQGLHLGQLRHVLLLRMGPIRVTVRRGPVVEAVHHVHAVAIEGGRVVDSAGDPELVTFFRSSAKPIQALPLARERDDVEGAELAIACASHRAEGPQLEAARRLLGRAPATEEDLECGPQEGRGPSRIAHNCSGKHAGFLAVCRARAWETAGYRLPAHPLQQLLLAEIAAATEVPEGEIRTAVDGCGVVTFGLTLERMAHAFSRLARLDGGARVIGAMTAYPGLIASEHGGAADTDLMRLRPGWTAKGGAEGLMCAAGPDGLGVALKVEDGNTRAVRPALASFLGLGAEFGTVPVGNSRGETVGEVSVE